MSGYSSIARWKPFSRSRPAWCALVPWMSAMRPFPPEPGTPSITPLSPASSMRQKAERPSALGKRQAMPTIAMGSFDPEPSGAQPRRADARRRRDRQASPVPSSRVSLGQEDGTKHLKNHIAAGGIHTPCGRSLRGIILLARPLPAQPRGRRRYRSRDTADCGRRTRGGTAAEAAPRVRRAHRRDRRRRPLFAAVPLTCWRAAAVQTPHRMGRGAPARSRRYR